MSTVSTKVLLLALFAVCGALALHSASKNVATRRVAGPNHIDGKPFFIYGSGQSFTPPAGFRLATMQEVSSQAFIDFYNNNGGFQDLPQTMDGCCIFNTSDGFLIYGGYNGGNPSYLAPYLQGGVHQCAEQLTNPVYLGTAFGAGNYQGLYFPTLNTSTMAMITATPLMSANLGCGGTVNTFAIYKSQNGPAPPPSPPTPSPSGPPFIVAATGIDFPSLPSGYELASFSDVTGSDFVSYYNGGNLQVPASISMAGCCYFNTTDGYLMYGNTASGSTVVVPYTSSQSMQCVEQLSDPVWFGTLTTGPFPSIFIGNLTPQNIKMLSATYTIPSYDCQPPSPEEGNTFAIAKLQQSSTTYMVYATGPDFPTGPSGYTLMSLSDVQSWDFLSYVNNQKLDDGQEQMSGCCIFNLTDGFLLFNGSYVAPYTPQGAHQCSVALQNPVALGTAYDYGPIPGQFLGNFTQQSGQFFTTIPDMDPSLGCNPSLNAYALFKST